MRRLWTSGARRIGVVVLIVSGVIAASAMGGLPDNQYEGRAEGDSDTYVGFDVVKQQGKRKVARVSALLFYNCQGGGGGVSYGRVSGKLRVNDNDRFRGKLTGTVLSRVRGLAGRGPATALTYLFKGKLLKQGRARGRIDANLKVPPARGAPPEPGSRCYSGELDWRAKRGAEVTPTGGM